MSECLLVPPRLSAVQNTDASSPARRPGTAVHGPPHPASVKRISEVFPEFMSSFTNIPNASEPRRMCGRGKFYLNVGFLGQFLRYPSNAGVE